MHAASYTSLCMGFLEATIVCNEEILFNTIIIGMEYSTREQLSMQTVKTSSNLSSGRLGYNIQYQLYTINYFVVYFQDHSLKAKKKLLQ